jgi:hypothetical protein
MKKAPLQRRPTFTSINQTKVRLGKSRYQIMGLIGAGELQAETLDGFLIVRTDSLEKFEQSKAA